MKRLVNLIKHVRLYDATLYKRFGVAHNIWCDPNDLAITQWQLKVAWDNTCSRLSLESALINIAHPSECHTISNMHCGPHNVTLVTSSQTMGNNMLLASFVMWSLNSNVVHNKVCDHDILDTPWIVLAIGLARFLSHLVSMNRNNCQFKFQIWS